MSRKATMRAFRVCAGFLVSTLFVATAWAQRPALQPRRVTPDWRRIGNSAFQIDLPSVATGPVNRVWYSADGSRLFARTDSGQVFDTIDFENWKPADQKAPALRESAPTASRPEPTAQVRLVTGMP